VDTLWLNWILVYFVLVDALSRAGYSEMEGSAIGGAVMPTVIVFGIAVLAILILNINRLNAPKVTWAWKTMLKSCLGGLRFQRDREGLFTLTLGFGPDGARARVT
jgi:hypothetical protein